MPCDSLCTTPVFVCAGPTTQNGLPSDLGRRIERALDLVSSFVSRCEQIDPEVAMTPFSADRHSESQDRGRQSHSQSHSVPSSSPVGSLVSTPRHEGPSSQPASGGPPGLHRAASDSVVEYGDGCVLLALYCAISCSLRDGSPCLLWPVSLMVGVDVLQCMQSAARA